MTAMTRLATSFFSCFFLDYKALFLKAILRGALREFWNFDAVVLQSDSIGLSILDSQPPDTSPATEYCWGVLPSLLGLFQFRRSEVPDHEQI
jgi:hypothetical protein